MKCINGIDQIQVLAANGKPSILFEGLLDAMGDSQLAYQAYLKTQTQSFKSWFEGSQVVDANGEPKIMYHGTSNSFDTFDSERKGSAFAETGIFFTDNKVYANNYGNKLMPVFLKINNLQEYSNADFLLEIEKANFISNDIDGLSKTNTRLTEYIVFNPNQIKSVFNSGDFNNQDNNIYFNINPNKVKAPEWYAQIISELQRVRNGENNKSLDATAKSAKYVRYFQLKKQIEDLQEISQQGAGNYFDAVKGVALQHKQWIVDNVIDSPKKSEDATTYANELIKVWKNIDKVIYNDKYGTKSDAWATMIKEIKSEYAELDVRFQEIAERVITNMGRKSGIPTPDDSFTNLKDINTVHYLTLGLNRNPNSIVQLFSKLLRESEAKKDLKIGEYNEKILYLNKFLKDNNIDTDRFFQVKKDSTGKILKTHKLLSLITDNYYNEWAKVKKMNKPTLKQISDLAQVLDIGELYELDTNGNVILKDNSVYIKSLSDKLGRGDEIERFINKQLDKQREKIQKYLADREIHLINKGLTQAQIEDISFTSQEKESFLKWVAINSPFRYKDNLIQGNFTSRNYITLIPSKEIYVDKNYLDVVKDDNYNTALTMIKNLTKEALDALPTSHTRNLHDSFVPVVHSSLIKENLSLVDQLATLKNKATYFSMLEKAKNMFVAPNYIKTNETLEDTIAFLDDNETIEKNMQSKDIPSTLGILGKMAFHYKYFNENKPTILLMKDLIETSNNLALGYDGKPQFKKGDYAQEQATKNLPNLIKMIEENLSQTMYLNRVTPEIPLTSFNKTDFKTIYDVIEAEKKKATTQQQKDELSKEEEMLEKAQENLNKDWKNRFKDNLKIQKFETTEKLIQYYADKVNTTRNLYRRGQLSKDEYKAEMGRWSNRLQLINKNTIYGSKVLDGVIQYKRLVTLGLSPFSGFNNLMSALAGGLVYSAGGVDFTTKDFMKSMGIIMTSWKNIQGKSDMQAKKLLNIAKKLQIDKELVDMQGISEGTNFDKYAYYLMKKSENFGRMSLVVAYLLGNKEGEKSLWDSFDEEGNWIGENADQWLDVESPNKLQLIGKLQKITGVVMGTTDIKIANKYIAGRLVGQFRLSWLPEVFASRFESESFDERLGRNVKGRYLTYKDLGWTNSVIGVIQVWTSYFGKAESYKNLYTRNGNPISQTDIENLRKNAAEALLIASVMMAIASLKALSDDDEKNKKLYSFLLNQFFFLEKDLTSFSPSTITELISGNLIPSYKLVQDFTKFTTAFYDYAFGDEDETDKMYYQLTKIVPGLNVLGKYKLYTERALE